MTLLAIFEALVGANAIWETTVQYVRAASLYEHSLSVYANA